MNAAAVSEAIKLRNVLWADEPRIPSWVSIDSVELDQFFTKDEIAQYCWNQLRDYLDSAEVSLDEATFLEPSAGSGSFLRLLPEQSRIGIDIAPLDEEISQGDFLSWTPEASSNGAFVTVGNPPFGYRGWLALEFMNHAASFSDYVGMILPMSFQSDGKGSPKLRV